MNISETGDLRFLAHINKRKYIFMEKQKKKSTKNIPVIDVLNCTMKTINPK